MTLNVTESSTPVNHPVCAFPTQQSSHHSLISHLPKLGGGLIKGGGISEDHQKIYKRGGGGLNKRGGGLYIFRETYKGGGGSLFFLIQNIPHTLVRIGLNDPR